MVERRTCILSQCKIMCDITGSSKYTEFHIKFTKQNTNHMSKLEGMKGEVEKNGSCVHVEWETKSVETGLFYLGLKNI